MFNDILSYLQFQLGTMDWSLSWTNMVEIVIIVGILFAFYKKFIKDSQSEKFVKGIFFLIFLWVFSEVLVRLDLKILGMFLKSIVTLISLSLIVIFQPELRRFLGFLGQADIFTRLFGNNDKSKSDEKIDVIKELVEAVKFLSKSHTGALMVFQKDLSNTYSDVGTKLNADLSTELLLTIFHVNTPLHDGAVLLEGTRLTYAGCILPLTKREDIAQQYGTRHRAAIGITEETDAVVIVVSEERGEISVTEGGNIIPNLDANALRETLSKLIKINKSTED